MLLPASSALSLAPLSFFQPLHPTSNTNQYPSSCRDAGSFQKLARAHANIYQALFASRNTSSNSEKTYKTLPPPDLKPTVAHTQSTPPSMAEDDAITYAPNPAPAATHHSSSTPLVPSAPITIPPPNSNRLSLTAHCTHPPPSQQEEEQHLPTSASSTHPHASPSPLPIPATGYGYGYNTGLDDGPLQPDFPAAAAGEAPRLPSLPPNSIDNLPLPVPLPPPPTPPRRQPGQPVFCACAAAPAGRASALKTFRIRTTLRGVAIWARFLPFAISGDAFAKPGGSAPRELLPTEREHVIRVALGTGTPDLLAPTQVGWWFALHEATEVGSGSWTGMRKERKRMVYGEILEGRDGVFGG